MELSAEGFLVDFVGPGQFIALLDLRERLGILGQFVGPQGDLSALPGADIDVRPPIRFVVREFNVVDNLDDTVDQGRQLAFGGAVLDRDQQVALADREVDLRVGDPLGRPAVTLDDVIDIDVPPTAGGVVDDLDDCHLAGEIADIP